MAETTVDRVVVSAAPEPAYYSAPVRWFTVGVLTALYAVSLVDRMIFALLVEPIRKSLSLSDFQISLVHGLAFAVFYAVFGILFGWMADRCPRRAVIGGGVTIWSVATAACGLARNFGQLAFARFSVGAGEAALNPAAYSMISDSFPRERLSLAMAVFGIGATLGTMLAKLSGAFLMQVIPEAGMTLPLLGHLEPWRVVFIAVALPGLLLSLLVWAFPEPVRRQRAGVKKISYADAASFMWQRRAFFLPFFIGCSLIYATNNAYGTWSATFLIRRYGLTVSEVGYMLAAATVAPPIIGTLGAGWIADRFFSRGVSTIHIILIIIMAVAKAAAIIIGIATHSMLATILFFALATTFSGITGVAPAAMTLVTSNERRGQVSASYLFLMNLIGMGIGPIITGAIATYVFHDRAMLGSALVATFLLLQPVSVFFLWRAMRGMRAIAGEAETWKDS